MLCFVYVCSDEDLNHTSGMQKMTYIISNGPKMSYINKRLINVKKIENNDKVAWYQNKLQFIVLLVLYTNALLCMSNYITSASLAINPPILRHCLEYINAICAPVMMASRKCLTSDPSRKIPLSMPIYAISIIRQHLGKTSSAWSICAWSSSSISW